MGSHGRGLALVALTVLLCLAASAIAVPQAQGQDLPFVVATGIDSRCQPSCDVSDITSGFSTHANVDWPASTATGFDSYGFDFTVTNETTQGNFVSGQFSFLTGDGGYAGIQTNVSGLNGKGAIFSIFTDAVDARSTGNGQVVNNCEVMFPGGPCIGFWSVRMPFDWQVGQTGGIEVRRAETDGAFVWYDAFVITPSGDELTIGGIKVPQTVGFLRPVSFWLEHYGSQLASVGCLGPDLFTVEMTDIRASRNGTVSSPTRAVWTTALVTACPGIQQTSGLPNGVTHRIGGLATPVCNGKVVTIDMRANGGNGLGTNGPDVILGTSSSDVITGLGGNDTICAGAGNDTVRAGDGDDTVFGGSDDDRIWGDAGRDHVRAGSGDDTVFGGPDIDRIWGDSGSDSIDGDGGSDRIFGGIGDDTVRAGSGADRVRGGPGNDDLRGMGGQDFMWGDSGNDTLQGNWQSDRLRGGPGDDVLRGAQGKDKLYGEAGDDRLFGGDNTDFLDGGPGNDFGHGQRGKDNPIVADVSGCIVESRVSC